MCKIISIVNNKGGVGKTTSSIILSELLAWTGKKVLLIDLDQQGNSSMSCGFYTEDSDEVLNSTSLPAESDYHIAELFKFRYRTSEEMQKIIRHTGIPGFDIIPSSKRHKNTPLVLNSNTGNNNIILRRALNSIKENYDYILIDNAPANDILTVNSLIASDFVIIPVRVEKYSYKGLRETIDTIVYIKEEHGIDNVQLGGAFITQAEIATNIYKDIKECYLSELGGKFYHTPIRKDVKISEIETNFKPILSYAQDCRAVFDYSVLLLEMNILDAASTELLQRAIHLFACAKTGCLYNNDGKCSQMNFENLYCFDRSICQDSQPDS